MNRVHIVWDEFQPILACDSLDDAYEMLLSFYEEEAYENFLSSCLYYKISPEIYFEGMKSGFKSYNHYNPSKKYETVEAYILDQGQNFSIHSLWRF